MLGFNCTVNEGAEAFAEKLIGTPLVALTLLLLWRGTRMFRPELAGRGHTRAEFWAGNLPALVYYALAIISLAFGLKSMGLL